MICITGDTHGCWVNRLKTDSFPEQKEMTKDDYVIILGDFGIWDNSNMENHNLSWLDDKPFTTLFIAGNHDNYDILDSLPVSEWNGGKVNFISPSVIHLMRGQVYGIDDLKFFAFGGASSHDIRDGIIEKDDPRLKKWKKDRNKKFRVNHVHWWERELPSQEEMDDGFANLNMCERKVDFILSHCCPSSTLALMSHGAYKPDILTNYFEEVRTTTEYKKWFFGHYHINKNVTDKEICLFKQIIRIA